MSRSLVLSVMCLAAISLALSGCGNKEPAQSEAVPQLTDLFHRLGGEQAIRAVVVDYVDITSKNPKVNFTRKGTPAEWNATPENVAKATEHMVQFMCLITGDANARYEGRNMVEAHRNMHITNAEFDATLEDLRQAMVKNNIPTELQDEVIQVVDRLTRNAIVEVAE